MNDKDITATSVILFTASLLILGFVLGATYTHGMIDSKIIVQYENPNSFSVYERGEIVTTSEDFYNAAGYNFTGTIVHINYHEFGNVLTIYNSETEESNDISELWIDGFAKRNYEVINNE